MKLAMEHVWLRLHRSNLGRARLHAELADKRMR